MHRIESCKSRWNKQPGSRILERLVYVHLGSTLPSAVTVSVHRNPSVGASVEFPTQRKSMQPSVRMQDIVRAIGHPTETNERHNPPRPRYLIPRTQ